MLNQALSRMTLDLTAKSLQEASKMADEMTVMEGRKVSRNEILRFAIGDFLIEKGYLTEADLSTKTKTLEERVRNFKRKNEPSYENL